MKLMVLNLPRSVSEDELAKLLKQYGKIRGCKLVMDTETGRSKGFGFVEMALEHEALVAIKELNGSMLKDKKIRVKAQ